MGSGGRAGSTSPWGGHRSSAPLDTTAGPGGGPSLALRCPQPAGSDAPEVTFRSRPRLLRRSCSESWAPGLPRRHAGAGGAVLLLGDGAPGRPTAAQIGGVCAGRQRPPPPPPIALVRAVPPRPRLGGVCWAGPASLRRRWPLIPLGAAAQVLIARDSKSSPTRPALEEKDEGSVLAGGTSSLGACAHLGPGTTRGGTKSRLEPCAWRTAPAPPAFAFSCRVPAHVVFESTVMANGRPFKTTVSFSSPFFFFTVI